MGETAAAPARTAQPTSSSPSRIATLVAPARRSTATGSGRALGPLESGVFFIVSSPLLGCRSRSGACLPLRTRCGKSPLDPVPTGSGVSGCVLMGVSRDPRLGGLVDRRHGEDERARIGARRTIFGIGSENGPTDLQVRYTHGAV